MNDIFQQITTKDMLNEITQKLSNIASEMFSVKKSASEHLAEELPTDITQAILTHFSKNKQDVDNHHDFQAFVTQFVTEAEKLPVIHITLGISPTDKILQKITQWIKLELHALHVLAVTVDTSLISGAAVGYRGHYKDYSIKKQLEEYFEKNKS